MSSDEDTLLAMQSAYSEEEALRLVSEFAATAPEDLARRLYTARLLGQEENLVLHGGGNTSVKSRIRTLHDDGVDVLYIKGSGHNLATIGPEGHPAVRLAPLLRLRDLDSLTDEEMVRALRATLIDPDAPTPSVETLLHAFIPEKFIDHTHADAILAVSCQPNGRAICEEIFENHLIWIPYVMPGFELARRAAKAYEVALREKKKPYVMVLQRHGLFTFGATAKESYESTLSAVSRAESYLSDHRRTVHDVPVTFLPESKAIALPILRGVWAKLAEWPEGKGPIVTLLGGDDPVVEMFLRRPDAKELVRIGCATPDHVLRTKATALYMDDLSYENPALLRIEMERGLMRYAEETTRNFHELCREKKVNPEPLPPFPRVVILPKLGVCAVGASDEEAEAIEDIYRHTMDIMMAAQDIGAYSPVGRSDLFDVEYWSLEQAKLKKKRGEEELAGRIALITGAASGIGRMTAERFLERGAHALLVDRDTARLEETYTVLAARFHGRVAVHAADVTEHGAPRLVVQEAIGCFGGLDMLVSNAGDAREGDLDTEEGYAALEKSLQANLLSHAALAKEAVHVFDLQGRGGVLLFNASKSAFAPGPHFGPYAVAKAGLVALMRQCAVDYGSRGIRANAVNADRVRTGLFEGKMLESRARARGLSVDEYFRANLLGQEVHAADVANAFLYLATARSTTGCVLTVDGGNPAAFPR